jgi:general secretion pathway protein H
MARGFTLIELMVVMLIVGIASAVISVALPDRAQARLDEEAERLAALLEAARSEARASGIAVRWELASADATDGAHFRFPGLPPSNSLPRRWLAEGVSAEVVGARALILGPEPILPAQRVVLRLDDRRVVLGSDGLAPFAAVSADGAAASP